MVTVDSIFTVQTVQLPLVPCFQEFSSHNPDTGMNLTISAKKETGDGTLPFITSDPEPIVIRNFTPRKGLSAE
jgi:hypothetical protein